MMNHLHKVKVFAPATSANVVVGFDILGFAISDLGDEVTLIKSADHYVKITSLSCNDNIPVESERNTATVAMQAMLDYLNLKQGFDVIIQKNIPVSSGLGGSAASSVAAVTALNAFLKKPLSREELVEFALTGEQAACGSRHGDNVIPCLFGGMTLIQSLSPVEVIQLPLIPLYVVLIHPHLQLDTRLSRAVLKQQISLTDFVTYNARLAAFISALYEKNYARIESSCIDEIIEPSRAHLIPGFYDVKSAAYQYGALVCSISGSGPTLFAMAKTKSQAQNIANHMSSEFRKNGIDSDALITTIAPEGCRIIYDT